MVESVSSAEPDELARRLAAVVESSCEAIVALDPDGRIRAWNRGATAVYGYAAGEAIGEHFAIVDEEASGDVARLIERAVAGETVRNHEGVRRRKDGTRVDIATTYTPITNDDGELIAISVVGRDVSEIRHSQRCAERAAHDLDIVLNSAAEAIYRLDADGRVTFANRAAGRLFGIRPEELVGQHMHATHHHTRPDGSPFPADECPIVTAVPTGRTVRLCSELFFRIDGAPFYADITVTPAIEENEVTGAVVMLSDVSERITAEQAAQDAMARFQSAFQDAPIGMALLDLRGGRAGRYLEVNEALSRMLGYPADELIGRSYEDFTHPEDLDGDRTTLDEVLRGGPAGAATRKRYIARDGRTVWVLRTASVVRDVKAPYGILQIQDITKHVRAEEELRRSELRYRTLLETANEGVWAVDAEGCTTYVNARMGEILGLPPSEVTGRTPHEFTTDSRAVQSALVRLRAGEPARVEAVMRRPDGGTVPVLVSAAPLRDADGGFAGALGMVVDLRDRLRAEEENQLLQEQLHQAQKLETVGQLAGGIAHDFNNLLAVIMNYAEFAHGAMEGHPARDDVAEISRAAERATELTQQLLLFSRKGVVTKEPLGVNAVIRDFERLLRRAVGNHVLVELDLAPNLPRVLVNRGQLEQVLLNLAINAGDAMPEGGTLVLSTSKGAQGVRLTVADSGTGMTPEVRERVFEPFFTTKPHGTGTGLGLATAYGMVTEAGGRIDIESTPGSGTTVLIDLPPAPAPSRRGPSGELPRLNPQKGVLVVEDEPAVRRLTARILEDSGYRVFEAANGNDALRLIEERNGEVQLVITDVVMPELSGTALAAKLAERWPDVPVLFMSGYTDRPERVPPGARLIAKPFNATQLLAEVEPLIERAVS